MSRRGAMIDPWRELVADVRHRLKYADTSRRAAAETARRVMYVLPDGDAAAYMRALNALRELAGGWADVPAEAVQSYELALRGLVDAIDAWPVAAKLSADGMRTASERARLARAERRARVVSAAAGPRPLPYYLRD